MSTAVEPSSKGWNMYRKLWTADQTITSQSHRSNTSSGSSSNEEISPRDCNPQLYIHPHLVQPQNTQKPRPKKQIQISYGEQNRQDSSNDFGTHFNVKAVTKALLHRRRLSVEPDKKIYFPYEPGKQVTSAVRIKNVTKSSIAFKFQTNAPKSCFMRPPSGVLSPGECMVATVVKHIHHAEQARRSQARDKFKIVSLKMAEGLDFFPEMFDQLKDLVSVESILRVHFLDPETQSNELAKLKQRIAEADAFNESCKKSVSEEKPAVHKVGEGNILEEWNKMKLTRHL